MVREDRPDLVREDRRAMVRDARMEEMTAEAKVETDVLAADKTEADSVRIPEKMTVIWHLHRS